MFLYKCTFCKKVILLYVPIAIHYNWITKETEYYHKECRNNYLLKPLPKELE